MKIKRDINNMSKNKGNGIKQMFTQKIYLVTIPA